ncbi:MAG: Hsp33 family molecular chaperone HslO [Clostridia bacterium]|nr:Hsp33 family molecular chaperone HslO [Clostridia bacterium]
MSKAVRCITKEGAIVMMAADTTDIVARAEQIHQTSAVTTAALGRLLTACSLMGQSLKGAQESLSLQIKGGGPAGTLVAVSDSSGNVRGYIEHPVVELPLNRQGKLDVGGAVGKTGNLYVVKDLGLKEPYVGQVPLVSGEIAEDITSYFAVSEQIPTVCALGVLVNPDLSCKAAGGFIIQLLPSAMEEDILFVENAVKELENVSSMIARGMSPEEICRFVLKGREVDVLDESDCAYRCNCSRERIERALISTGKKTLEELAREGKTEEINCQYCDKKYYFEKADFERLLRLCSST